MEVAVNQPDKLIACPLCLKKWPQSKVDSHVSFCLRSQQRNQTEYPEQEENPIIEKGADCTLPAIEQETLSKRKTPEKIPGIQSLGSVLSPSTKSTTSNSKNVLQPFEKMPRVPKNIPFEPPKKLWPLDKKYEKKNNVKPTPKIGDIPVFRPTEQEFKNPMKYISSIKDRVRRFGAAKIIPPSDKWLGGKPFQKVISNKNFIFPTKVQNLHQLQTRSGPCSKFLKELESFLETRGTPLKSIPIVDGQELDLYSLYNSVMARGGLEMVIINKRWREVAKDLRISSECTNAGFVLKHHYVKYLYAYEMAQKKQETDRQIEMTLDDPGNKIEEEFGYDDGKMFTLSSFKKMANTFKKKWFLYDELATPEAIEAEYWKIVENADECVQVHYGSDLDVGTYGSGFPRDPQELKKASGWNLNKFAKLPDSLLSHLEEDIVGVVRPMMYIGMLFSTFCWHTEDNYLYSINYLHHGAPKTWYSIPEHAHDEFEKVMKKTVPELFQTHPDLLFMLITMISPRILEENKVPIYKTVQEAGEFMITFPKAYHAGFSHGFNCAESSNFALDDWFSYGRESIQRYRQYNRASVFSFEELVVNAALCKVHPPSKQVLSRLQLEIPIIRKVENDLRNKALMEGTWKCVHFDKYEGKNQKIKECSVCKYDCYLSGLVCPCSPSKIVCLFHSHKLCGCDPRRKYLLFRYKISQMDEIMKRLLSSEQNIPEEYKIKPLVLWNTRDIDFSLGRGVRGKRRNPSEELVISSKKKLARKSGAKSVSTKELVHQYADEDMYIIDKIVDSRTVNGEQQYRLKWVGFPSSESTWEKEEELICCPALLDSFARRR